MHQAKLPNDNLRNFEEGISGRFVIANTRFIILTRIIRTLRLFSVFLRDCLCDCLVGMNVWKLFKTIKINDEGPDLILSMLPEHSSQLTDVFYPSFNDACREAITAIQGVIKKSVTVEACSADCTEALAWLSHGCRLQDCALVYKDGRLPCPKHSGIITTFGGI